MTNASPDASVEVKQGEAAHLNSLNLGSKQHSSRHHLVWQSGDGNEGAVK